MLEPGNEHDCKFGRYVEVGRLLEEFTLALSTHWQGFFIRLA